MHIQVICDVQLSNLMFMNIVFISITDYIDSIIRSKYIIEHNWNEFEPVLENVQNMHNVLMLRSRHPTTAVPAAQEHQNRWIYVLNWGGPICSGDNPSSSHSD